jgi:hypothetical protein
MMKTPTRSIITTVLISALVVSCATPHGQGNISQNNPCQPGSAQLADSPTASFIKQAILNPLANIGGTVLATAAANYSQQYTGKLNTLLTKLVTPKEKKKKKKNSGQEFSDFGLQQGQPDFNTGFPQPIDPNTGLPIQTDPNTGLPIQIDPNTGLPIGDQQGFDHGQFPGDPNTEFGESQPFDPGVQQEAFFDPNVQGEVQPRGVPGQLPHATFPSTPCDQPMNPQAYPAGYPQNQPYGHDPNMAQQGQPYPNDQNYQGQGYDPYGQTQGQNPYGQPYPDDPYPQQGYPQDPYGQQAHPSDPYAQQNYPEDPYGQQAHPSDPYAQQNYPEDPYAQQGYSQDPNAQGYAQPDPYAEPTYQQENPYAQQPNPQDSHGQAGTSTGIQTQETGTPIGMDVVMVKKTIRNGATVVLPIKDGDALKDGRGNPQAGDKFRIMFRPNTDGYVYVIAIDGSGWAQGIFPPPTSPLANPVKAGEQYVLPEGNNWFSLDQYQGVETIFFVTSQEKRQDIEEILQSITGRERPASESPQQVTKVAMVPYGVGGARPSTQPFNLSGGPGQDQTIIPTSYLAQKAGQDLRLTRWFRHE